MCFGLHRGFVGWFENQVSYFGIPHLTSTFSTICGAGICPKAKGFIKTIAEFQYSKNIPNQTFEKIAIKHK
jgi:hypothetical protein